jgi:hypothetical protein
VSTKSIRGFEKLSSPINKVSSGIDSLVATRELWNLTICQEIVQSVGMELNMEKSQIQRDLHSIKFLGYIINNGVPEKLFDDWITALCFPEYPDQNFDMVQSRALGLLYANMGVDEKFHNLCVGLVRLQPFDLTLPKNLKRMLQYIGIQISEIDPINLQCRSSRK